MAFVGSVTKRCDTKVPQSVGCPSGMNGNVERRLGPYAGLCRLGPALSTWPFLLQHQYSCSPVCTHRTALSGPDVGLFSVGPFINLKCLRVSFQSTALSPALRWLPASHRWSLCNSFVDADNVFLRSTLTPIVECVNVLGFMTGHRLDDLRNNSFPGDLTARRVEACARSSITVQS